MRTLVLYTLVATACAVAGEGDDPALLTVAEKSEYRATARYAEVVALCERLASASPLVKLGSLGKSAEGRDLPLLLVADPPVSLPTEATTQAAGSSEPEARARSSAVSPERRTERSGNALTDDDRLLVLMIA